MEDGLKKLRSVGDEWGLSIFATELRLLTCSILLIFSDIVITINWITRNLYENIDPWKYMESVLQNLGVSVINLLSGYQVYTEKYWAWSYGGRAEETEVRGRWVRA